MDHDQVSQCVIAGAVTVVARTSGIMKVHDARTRTRMQFQAVHAVRSCAVSTDGAWIATAAYDDTNVYTYSTCTGAVHHVLVHVSHDDDSDHTTACCCAFACDGRLLVTGADDGCARLWDVVSGVLMRTVRTHMADVIDGCDCGHYSRTLVATASWTGRVLVWHTDESRSALVMCDPKINPMMSAHCCLSPDDALVAASFATGAVYLWEACSGVLLHMVCTPLRMPFRVAISADYILAVPSSNGCVRFHDARTADCVVTVRFPWGGPVIAAAFSADDNRLVVGTAAGHDQVHDVRPWLRNHRRCAVLVVIAAGARRGRARLPHELWDWMAEEGFL
jgi:WD40 repeat protein